jgi:ABC-type molybdate transport system substrate-binding protein
MRALAIVLALCAASGTAGAGEINAFISTAIKAVTDELLPPFERANGHTIRASYAPSGALIPRFERGEPVDVFRPTHLRSTVLSNRAGSWVATSISRGPASAAAVGAPRPDP